MPYLLKSEPEAYSIDDLLRDGETIWDGVKNPVALHNLAGMKHGDKLAVYHTGNEKQVVGIASVVSVDSSNPKNPQVRIGAGHKLKAPRTLSEIKANSLFSDSPLVRQGRLSVVPLTEKQFAWLTTSRE